MTSIKSITESQPENSDFETTIALTIDSVLADAVVHGIDRHLSRDVINQALQNLLPREVLEQLPPDSFTPIVSAIADELEHGATPIQEDETNTLFAIENGPDLSYKFDRNRLGGNLDVEFNAFHSKDYQGIKAGTANGEISVGINGVKAEGSICMLDIELPEDLENTEFHLKFMCASGEATATAAKQEVGGHISAIELEGTHDVIDANGCVNSITGTLAIGSIGEEGGIEIDPNTARLNEVNVYASNGAFGGGVNIKSVCP